MSSYNWQHLSGSYSMSHLVNAIIIAGVGLALWLSCLTIHRIFLHPFSKHPGPLLARFSGLPVLYHAYKGDFHHYIFRLHARYGETVRYSPNKISINRNVFKPETFYAAFRVNPHARNVFNTADKEEHRRKRRIMNKAFSAKALPDYAPFILSKVDELSVKLNGGQPPAGNGKWRTFNMADEVNYLMLDIMGGLCFGEAFGFVAGKGTEMMANVHDRAVRIYVFGQEPLLKRLSLDRLLFPRLSKAATALGQYTRYYTEKRIKQRNDVEADKEAVRERGYEDILAHLINNKDDETGSIYSPDELLGEATLLMMAGSDTSTTAINTTLFYVVNHPRVLRKLGRELSRCFPTVEDILPGTAENCRYLRACLDEAMRLCPSVPSSIPRVVGVGGAPVLGEHVPAGLWVSVPHFTLFRNARYFDRPHDFVPERWIVPDDDDDDDDDDKYHYDFTAEDVKRQQAAFQPFSLGPRHCVARSLALREMTFALARLFYQFDHEAVPGSGRWVGSLPGVDTRGSHFVHDQRDVFTSLETGPEVRLKSKAQARPSSVQGKDG
ncbi:cytochrome P450 [Apiospora saccharicola]